MDDKSLEKSSEGHPNAVVSLPEFPSEDRPFDNDRQDKAVQTMDNKSPDEALENSYEQPPNGYPNKASNKSSDECSDKSYHGTASSSSYSSHDTDIVDIRESEEYIRSSAKERRRLDKKQKKIEKRVKKIRLRRKIKAGKKAQAQKREDLAIWREIRLDNRGKVAAFEAESSRVQQCRAAEDRARDVSGAGGADGHKWSESHQRALELQRINDDYIKLAVELLRLRHWDYEGRETLQYRADEVTKLLNIFDVQWRQAYQRIGDNTVKLKVQALHSTAHDIRALGIEMEPKADDETVRSDRRPKTKRPKTKRAPPIKKPKVHPSMAVKTAKKPAKPRRQRKPRPEKLRRSSRLLAQKAGREE